MRASPPRPRPCLLDPGPRGLGRRQLPVSVPADQRADRKAGQVRTGKRDSGPESERTGKRDRSDIGTGKRDNWDRKAGQIRYWQYGQAEKSPDLAISDLSRLPRLCPASSSLSRFLVSVPLPTSASRFSNIGPVRFLVSVPLPRLCPTSSSVPLPRPWPFFPSDSFSPWSALGGCGTGAWRWARRRLWTVPKRGRRRSGSARPSRVPN